MLSSASILDLVSKPHTGVQRGKVMHLARQERTARDSTPAQRAFLEDMSKLPAESNDSVRAYDHPASRPVLRQPGPLTPSELLYLQRLPSDPTQVSHEDARVLAGMAASLTGVEHTADRRAVDQSYLPVRDVHDATVAKLALDDMSQTPAPIPSSVLNALADAVHAETPVLHSHEVLSRAHDLLSKATETRSRGREQRRHEAQVKADSLADAVKQRTATTKVRAGA